MEVITEPGGEIRGYAFVDIISKPSGEGANPYQRLDIVLDVFFEPALDSDRDAMLNPDNLGIVRIMSTLNRLQSLFPVEEIIEGAWFSVTFQSKEGNPPAWILGATDDYNGPIKRTNLVGMEPLPMKNSWGPKIFPYSYRATQLRQLEQEQTTQDLGLNVLPCSPDGNYSVRVVDVGHANFSAIHSSRELNPTSIVGYFDVGGPVFFHHHSFPDVFHENKRVPSQGFVALSHWDFDHYSLAVTKLKSLQKLSWFAPDQPVGPNAARLQHQLGENLTLITQPSFQITKGLDLWKGSGSAADRNNSGYVLTVSGQTTKLLLTGDVDYDRIPTQAKSNLSGLSITHHGGSGSGTPPLPMNGQGMAAVSYGIPNRYHHPDEDNLQRHDAVGWTVQPTFVTKTQRGDVWLD
jgi:hypothetical protein